MVILVGFDAAEAYLNGIGGAHGAAEGEDHARAVLRLVVLGRRPCGVLLRDRHKAVVVFREEVAKLVVFGEVVARPVEVLAHGADLPLVVHVLPRAHGHAVGPCRAEQVGVSQRGAEPDARVRIPPSSRGVLVLVGLGTAIPQALEITAPQGHRAGHHLDVEAMAAARAVVDKQARTTFQHGVPEPPEVVDVVDFSRAAALALGGFPLVGVPPVLQRDDVAVLTVASEVQFLDHAENFLNHGIAHGVVGEVDKDVVLVGGVEVEVPRPVGDVAAGALGLEPHKEFAVMVVQGLYHIAVALGMVEGADFPRADLGPVGHLLVGGEIGQRLVPARINPAVVEGKFGVPDGLPAALEGFRGHPAPEDGREGALVAARKVRLLEGRQFLADVAAPAVVGVVLPVGVDHDGGGRGAEVLAGAQAHMHILHAVTNAEIVHAAVKLRFPLPRPADGHKNAVLPVAVHGIEEGRAMKPASSALAGFLAVLARPHTDGNVEVVVVPRVGTLGGVQDHGLEFPRALAVAAVAGGVGAHGDGDVAVREVGDKTRLVVGGVGPVVRPLDNAVPGEEFIANVQSQTVGENVGEGVVGGQRPTLEPREGNAVVGKRGLGVKSRHNRGGAVAVHEVVDGLQGGLGGVDADVGACVVAVVLPLLLALARMDKDVQGVALVARPHEDHVAGLQFLNGFDFFESLLDAPVGQRRPRAALAVLDGLDHDACLKENPVHEAIAGHDLGVVVESGIDGRVAVDELTVADVVADLFSVVQNGGPHAAVRLVEGTSQLVGDNGAIDAMLIGKRAGLGIVGARYGFGRV